MFVLGFPFVRRDVTGGDNPNLNLPPPLSVSGIPQLAALFFPLLASFPVPTRQSTVRLRACSSVRETNLPLMRLQCGFRGDFFFGVTDEFIFFFASQVLSGLKRISQGCLGARLSPTLVSVVSRSLLSALIVPVCTIYSIRATSI